MLVLAGPGSGKTYVISQRIRYLIEEKKVEPERILTITFTKAAAQEMRQRCQTICPSAAGAVFGTFHSVFYHFLRSSETYQNVTLIKEKEKIQIMEKLLPMHDCTEQQKLFACQKMLQKISLYKNRWPQNQETEDDFYGIIKQYECICREEEKIDFDDMLVLCHELFLSDSKERDRWQKRFDYILVDEFQDVNGRQYEMTKMLAGRNGNLFVVGDDDQAIYSFRGSDPKYMKSFLSDFPKSRTVCLEENFRCGEKIVSLACKCIANNGERFLKKIRPVNEFDNQVSIKAFSDREKELGFIASKIKNGKKASTAVLVRTNLQAAYVAEFFWRKKIRCQIQERKTSFYENVWVQDVLAALRFCLCGRKRSDFLMFMNKPYRGIRRDMLKKEVVNFKEMHTEAMGRGQREVAEEIRRLERQCLLMQNMDAYGAVMLFLGAMHYQAYLESIAEGDEEILAHIREIIHELLDRARSFCRVLSWLEHAEQYSRLFMDEEDSSDEMGSGKTEEFEEEVQILTYHASKGLEFQQVFLPMLNSGIVPHGHMLTTKQMEEERRMFYVAMTRAKEKLCISWHGEDREKDASVFVKELLEK